ncbi:hypothetical protein FDECE_12003 [Fusarium decemcellulare]|nr:hypothetical protein FDECE_12003 [Fusarium decemcellulare]
MDITKDDQGALVTAQHYVEAAFIGSEARPDSLGCASDDNNHIALLTLDGANELPHGLDHGLVRRENEDLGGVHLLRLQEIAQQVQGDLDLVWAPLGMSHPIHDAS